MFTTSPTLSSTWEQLVADNAAARSYEFQLRRARHSMKLAADAIEAELKDISRRFSEGFGNHSSPRPVQRRTPISSPVKNAVGLLPIVCSTEQHVTGCLEEKMEKIYTLRMRVYEMRADAKHSSHEWASLIDEIEEIEARALTFLVLPSISLMDSSDEDQGHHLQLVLNRLEQQALRCLETATRLSSTASGDASPSSAKQQDQRKPSGEAVPPVASDKPFPTLAQARQRVEQSTNLLYPLLSDYTLRESTLRVKRIISCACGQITGQDVNHCLDRLRYILAFLENKPIQATGLSSRGGQDATRISLSDLLPGDLGSAYAWRCLFSATLSQAEYQFFFCYKAAVVYAYMLLGILALHPETVPEFLAHVCLACPVLGLSVDKEASSTVESVMQSGDPLPRWRGTSRLFAALCVGHPPAFLKADKRPPPFTPALLWQVIAGIANQRFVPCATAEVLHGLLEVGGTTLMRLYGQQFDKLLSTIISSIQSSPELRHSSPEIALQCTIELAQQKKQFPHELSKATLGDSILAITGVPERNE
ncbi:hypothetical protein X801_08679, partial [Opisthorchis viverrini]